MSTLVLERADMVVVGWLDPTVPQDGSAHPAGPLFGSGKYAESEITMTGGGGHTPETTWNCGWCTGSVENGRTIDCY